MGEVITLISRTDKHNFNQGNIDDFLNMIEQFEVLDPAFTFYNMMSGRSSSLAPIVHKSIRYSLKMILCLFYFND